MLWNRLTKTNIYPNGKGQGYFRYYKEDGSYESILAIEGKLYKEGEELPINGLDTFQTERQVEAVQFRDKLYIATGTKIVTYNGEEAEVIQPYRPEAMEALYIGTNALADNPDQFITDSTSAYVQITGITASIRYGVVNKETVFTAYVSKPAGATIEYKWSYRKLGADTWIPWPSHPDFTADQKTFGFIVGAGDYEIQCLARKQGDTDPVLTSEYQLPKYSVKETDQNKTEDVSTIHQCNRILLHWNRVVLYGDPKQKDLIYISDLDRPDYIPTLNTLRFENTEQEGLTAVVKFREMLVAFTPHSIQALTGKGPEEYSRFLLSSSIGCIAPFSAAVMENYIAFLSYEGVYILKSIGYAETRVNVQKIDSKIDNLVPRDTNACAIVSEGQYQITFPDRNIRFRFYYHDGVWTKDESPKLDFSRLYEFGGQVVGQSLLSSSLYRKDSDAWSDDGYSYEDVYVSKDYDMGEPYNPKKLKEVQLLLGQSAYTNLSLYVYADGAEVISPDTSHAIINNLGEVVWQDENTPNITIDAGTQIGSWIMGKSSFGHTDSSVYKKSLTGKGRRVRVKIVHEEPKPNTVLGMGFIFKSRKP